MTSDRLIDLRRCASDKAAVVLASTDLLELIKGYNRCPHIVSTSEGTNYCDINGDRVRVLEKELAEAREELQSQGYLLERSSHWLVSLRAALGVPDGEDAVAFVERNTEHGEDEDDKGEAYSYCFVRIGGKP